MTDSDKRTELKNKIDAAEKRNQERSGGQSFGDYARETRDSATSFAKEHPITTVLGAAAIGVLIASLVPGPGRRLRKQATKQGAAWAGMLADLAVSYGSQALDSASSAARSGQGKLGDLGDALGQGARTVRKNAAGFADEAGTVGRDAGNRAARTFRDLRSRITN